MRETAAQPLPQLYAVLVEALAEDTDPFASNPFTQKVEGLPCLPQRRPAPRRFRTHHEYQTARFQEWWYERQEARAKGLDGLELTLDVGAWVPDRLIADEETMVVDVNTIAAVQRLRR